MVRLVPEVNSGTSQPSDFRQRHRFAKRPKVFSTTG